MKMEQLHISVPSEMGEWVRNNKEKHDCDSINSFGRYIIRDFQKRSENGDTISKNTDVKISMNHVLWSVFIPMYLFVSARQSNNDPLLFSLGIVALAGVVIMMFLVRKNYV